MTSFTREYFHAELVEFRKQFGLKSFWAEEGRHQAAVNGLAHVLLNTDGLQDGDYVAFESAVEECAHRELLLIRCGGIKQGRKD